MLDYAARHSCCDAMEEKVEEQKPAAAGPKVKQSHMLVAIVVVAIVLVAVFFGMSSSGQTVAVGDTVNVTYTGSFTNGTIFGSNVGGQPLQFTVGANQLIAGFDQGVIGMHVGENKTITVPVNEAYGPVNPSLIVHAPSNVLGNTIATVGMGITTVINGQEVQGEVIAVNSTNVTVNFNPPLAGKTLIFKIKVLAIKKG